MNPIKKAYWYDEAHKAIESGYASAEKSYNSQKKRFLNQISITTNEAAKQFMDQINMEVAAQVENDEYAEQINAAFDEIGVQLEAYFGSAFQNQKKGSVELQKQFKTIIKRRMHKYGDNSNQVFDHKQLYNSMIQHIETYLTTSGIMRECILSKFNSIFSNHQGNTDITNQIYGYTRQFILSKLAGGAFAIHKQRYITTTKGYLRELPITQAFNNVMMKYDNRLAAIHSAAMTNEKGQQSQIDIMLGRITGGQPRVTALDGIMEQLKKFPEAVDGQGIANFDYYGGIQSKSWVVPWEETIDSKQKWNQSFLTFGSHANLRPSGIDRHYWHAGVASIMSNLLEVVGPTNFIFSTGNQVYWTAELLSEFKERQYVLGFSWNKSDQGITASHVTAMQHEDID